MGGGVVPEPWALAVLTVAPSPALWSSVTHLLSQVALPSLTGWGADSHLRSAGATWQLLSLDSWLLALLAGPGSAPQTCLWRESIRGLKTSLLLRSR